LEEVENEDSEEEVEGEDFDNYEDDDELLPFKEATKSVQKEISDLDRKISDLTREIEDTKNLLQKDFGPEQEFYPLHGQCFSVTTNEYTYELCPFDRITQKPKNGGSSTSLGKWEDSKQGDDWSQLHKYMLYSGGLRCWSGPDRSTKVEVLCDAETKINNPNEPNKCEYTLQLYTPAACNKEHLQLLELDLSDFDGFGDLH